VGVVVERAGPPNVALSKLVGRVGVVVLVKLAHDPVGECVPVVVQPYHAVVTGKIAAVEREILIAEISKRSASLVNINPVGPIIVPDSKKFDTCEVAVHK
jgi:hypothetical protein